MSTSGPIDEARRVALINRLTEVLGEEEAKTLVESLPPYFWHQIATKQDVKDSESRLRSEMHVGFANVQAEFKTLRAENTEFRGETKGEFKTLRAENTKFKGEMQMLLAKHLRITVLTLVGIGVTIFGAILAVGLA